MKINPYQRKTQYYETDQMGIIHHSNYARWLEEARQDFLDQIGMPYQKISDSGIELVLLNLYCEFRSMVRYGETLNIHLFLSKLSDTRMTVAYRLLDAASGTRRAIGSTEHCFYDKIKNRSISLKKERPELFELFEAAPRE